jgi:hypothetical protein
MKTRTHFGHRIDMLDREGEIVEHLAGVEDSYLSMQPTRRRLGAGRKWQSSLGKAPGSFATAASRDW